MADDFELEVPSSLRRGAYGSTQEWIESAHQLLALVQRTCALSSLEGQSVLDMGCGTKMAKALLDRRVPIARYVGMDIDQGIIEFLRTHVDDPRFTFHHLDLHNELYNPRGEPLHDQTRLPLGDERFDIVWLFSVFTHLCPDDYRAMLVVLRNYVRADGWLIFSLFVNESTGTGFGPVDRLSRRKRSIDERYIARAIEKRIEERGEEWFARELQRRIDEQGGQAPPSDPAATVEPVRADGPRPSATWYVDADLRLRHDGEPPDFVDLIPQRPLMEPLYSRRHALELIEGTGWRVEALNPPEPEYIQHYFVCRPI